MVADIVALHGEPEPSPLLLELERLLQEAKAGRIHSLIAVYEDDVETSASICTDEGTSLVRLLGRMNIEVHRLTQYLADEISDQQV